MTTDELAQWRGFIMERAINLEWLVNAIISQHYFGKVRWDFVGDVLYDEYFNLGLKCRVLEKVLGPGDKKAIDDLRRLAKIRNHFAHRGPHVLTQSNPMGFAPDPKNLEEPLDSGGLFETFKELYPKVEKAFVEAFKSKGGLLSSESPWPSA